MKTIHDLVDILTLKKEDSQTYTGISKTIGNSRVFGGQVLAKHYTQHIKPSLMTVLFTLFIPIFYFLVI